MPQSTLPLSAIALIASIVYVPVYMSWWRVHEKNSSPPTKDPLHLLLPLLLVFAFSCISTGLSIATTVRPSTTVDEWILACLCTQLYAFILNSWRVDVLQVGSRHTSYDVERLLALTAVSRGLTTDRHGGT